MAYADSDFFLALLKESDWLRQKAERILEAHTGRIWTSEWTIIEILMLARELRLDPEEAIFAVRDVAKIEGDVDALLSAAHLMKKHNMNTFDAMHAVSCGHGSIISSDKIFDKLGMQRIRLEE